MTTDYTLGPVAQIPPGEGREFAVGGYQVAVFRGRVQDTLHATQATCPHRNGPLADGLLGGDTLVCPFHAWKFDLRTGLPLVGECGLAVYTVRLSPAGDMVLTLPADADVPHPTSGEDTLARCTTF